jgi:hypothetical protein
MRFSTSLQFHTTSFVSLVAAGLIAMAAMPGRAWAQATTPATPTTANTIASGLIEACYIPTTGAVYLIKEPSLKALCTSQKHIPFSWSQAGRPERQEPPEQPEQLAQLVPPEPLVQQEQPEQTEQPELVVRRVRTVPLEQLDQQVQLDQQELLV